MSNLKVEENTIYFYSSHEFGHNIEYQKKKLLNKFDFIAFESLTRMLTGNYINWNKWVPLKVITTIQSTLHVDNKYVFDVTRATENTLYFFTTHTSGTDVEYQKKHLVNKFSDNAQTSLYKMISGNYGNFSNWVHIPVLKPTFMLKNNSLIFYTSNLSGGRVSYQKKYLRKSLKNDQIYSLYKMLSGNTSSLTKWIPLPVLTSRGSELKINNKTVFDIENSPENKLYFYSLDASGECIDFQKKNLKHAMSNSALNSLYRMLTGNYGVLNNWVCLPVVQPLKSKKMIYNDLHNLLQLNNSVVYDTSNALENTIYFYTMDKQSGVLVNYQQKHLVNYDTPNICKSLFNMLTGLHDIYAFKVLIPHDSKLEVDNKNVFELSTAPTNTIYFYTSNINGTCFEYQQKFLMNYGSIAFRSYFFQMLINNCDKNKKTFSLPVLISESILT